MSDPAAPVAQRSSSLAPLLTLSGLAAAFGLASCCALPLVLATLGLGSAWLTGVALVAAPHQLLLMTVAALSLGAGGFLLWRQQRAATTCGPNGVCAPSALRALTLVGLVVGLALLWAGYAYA